MLTLFCSKSASKELLIGTFIDEQPPKVANSTETWEELLCVYLGQRETFCGDTLEEKRQDTRKLGHPETPPMRPLPAFALANTVFAYLFLKTNREIRDWYRISQASHEGSTKNTPPRVLH